MASRLFNANTLTVENEVVKLYGKLTIGSSGAVTKTRGKGFSVALSTTGVYIITLENKYPRLLKFDGTIVRSTAAGLGIQLNAEDVATNKTITLGVVDYETPAFTEPTSGDVIYVEITLGNTAD